MNKSIFTYAVFLAIIVAVFLFYGRRYFIKAHVSSELASFAALQLDPVDTHTHVFRNDARFVAMIASLHLHVLDIVVADQHNVFGPLNSEILSSREFIRGSKGHAVLCTTFDPFQFQNPAFAARVIEQLDSDFVNGAVAVKIWKNIGMELKDSDGKYIMPDDPIFDPIYKNIVANNKTLIAHLAEPTADWNPPDRSSLDYDYYHANPQWYMYLHPERPSKKAILTARDHLLAVYPQLRVVGAHLGSMETDVDEIARDLDRYPNFAVDTAARMGYLMIQPREKVRQFMIKYQDRILYGTDLDFLEGESAETTIEVWRTTYARDWEFLATDEELDYHGRHQGLKLPISVLKKIYHDNPVRWIPGILGTAD